MKMFEIEQMTIRHTTKRNQFRTGIYICPMNFFDVWMILRRGKQPSAIDCLMHVNVAVVIARLAIRAAILEMRKTGQNMKPETKKKRAINS